MTSLGNTTWKQSQDEKDPFLEIVVPLVLPPNVRVKDLQVIVKDGEIICVKHKETTLVQWRLYGRILPDVEWDSSDGGASIIIEMQKKDPSSWPCLLNLPMKPTDKIFASESELDAIFAKEMKPLPPVVPAAAPAPATTEESGVAKTGEDAPAQGEAAPAEAENGDVDLDALLDQAAEEIAKVKEQDAPSADQEEMDVYTRAELKGLEEEEKEIRAKIQELEEFSSDETKDEERRQMAEKQGKIAQRLLELHCQLRAQRSQPSSLKTFLSVIELDLLKARCNVGDMTESETEAFTSDEERELTPHELMSVGIHHLQQQDVSAALHFLRLAAIHHKHPTSTTILLRLYGELGSPKGLFLLLKRALMDTPDLDPQTNLQVGELTDKGVRHYPSLFGAAIFFYQRAAVTGNVHAMMALAQLYLRGGTSATLLTDEQRKANVSLEKYHAWLEQAVDRGAHSAYFVKGCMYLRGEHGFPASYKDAKKFLDLALMGNPEIARRAPNVPAALEKLRIEEEARSPTTPQSPAPSPTVPRQQQPPQDKQAPPAKVAFNVPAKSSQEATAAAGGSSTDRLAARLAAFDKQDGVVDLPRVGEPKKGGLSKKGGAASNLSSGVSSRIFWERVGTTGFALYAAYTLLFPIRIMLLPHFYTVVGNILDKFGSIGGGSRAGLL